MEQSKRLTCIQTAIKSKELPGMYIDNKTTWEFPPVENIDSKGNKSIWTISVFAYDTDADKKIPIDITWITCPILKQPASNIIAKILTTVKKHTGHLQVNDEVEVVKGKNIGKLNATTPISQAISEAYRKYINKYKLSNKPDKVYNEVRPFPMLLKKSGSTKSSTLTDADFKIGVAIQPKLDGIRTIAHMLNDKTIEFYSRKGLSFSGLNHIAVEVCRMLLQQETYKFTDIYLDGEIYIHNTPLQELSGAIRGENNQMKDKLEFHIFDCFILSQPDMIQNDRYKFLKSLFREKYRYTKLVPTFIVHNEEKLMQHYDEFIRDNYEGAISRKPTGIYKFGVGSQRSNDVTKIKPFSTDEFEVVGYEDGRGRDKGAVKFILKTEDGNEFAAVPNMTIERRKELFDLFKSNPKHFNKNYLKKMATIQYAIKSIKGIPTQPKFITLRDYE